MRWMRVLKRGLYGYKEELDIKALDDEGIFASGDKIKKYIPNIEDRDIENFIIVKSKLLYIGTNESENRVAQKLGLGDIGSGFSDAKAVIKEVQSIVDGVIELEDENNSNIPEDLENQNTETSKGVIGVQLVDRESHLIDGKWNILIDYDKNNKETERFESGYYWLKKGETYDINGKKINFKNDYVVNYNTKEYSVLSERVVNWNQNNVLAVPEKDESGKKVLALNLDTLSFENGQWKEHDENTVTSKSGETSGQEKFEDFYVKKDQGDTGYSVNTGIQKTGDVVYDENNGALKFNESAENKEGEGGYIKLSKTGDGESIDFSNGFTFELYGKLSRVWYTKDNSNINGRSGFFCKMSSLNSSYFQSLRFGFCDGGTFAKFSGVSSCYGKHGKLETTSSGNCKFLRGFGFFRTIVC